MTVNSIRNTATNIREESALFEHFIAHIKYMCVCVVWADFRLYLRFLQLYYEIIPTYEHERIRIK